MSWPTTLYGPNCASTGASAVALTIGEAAPCSCHRLDEFSWRDRGLRELRGLPCTSLFTPAILFMLTLFATISTIFLLPVNPHLLPCPTCFDSGGPWCTLLGLLHLCAWSLPEP